MRATSPDRICILNPLSSTLRHYEQELVDTLERAGYSDIEVIPTVEGEGISGIPQRMRVTLASLVERAQLGFSIRNQAVIVVVWPLFGYLDPWTLWGLCRHNRVLLVIHDPTPLRRAYGHSAFSRRLFKLIVQNTNVRVVYHTWLAQRVGLEVCGVRGTVVPHPIARHSDLLVKPSPCNGRSTIRVVGQYKMTRTLTPLESIAAHGADQFRLEIHGRGWPPVEGWTVSDRFIPEADFDELIRTSDCVVIPYSTFFQSGVAVRCLEQGVRVVAPRHEHIVELFGDGWPGLVDDEENWHEPIVRTLGVDRRGILARAEEVRTDITQAWRELIDG